MALNCLKTSKLTVLVFARVGLNLYVFRSRKIAGSTGRSHRSAGVRREGFREKLKNLQIKELQVSRLCIVRKMELSSLQRNCLKDGSRRN